MGHFDEQSLLSIRQQPIAQSEAYGSSEYAEPTNLRVSHDDA
jgi:hypothetical protein